MKKRLFCMVFCLAALLAILTVGALANDPEVVASGTCGDSVTWALDDNGTMTISGTGDMDNYYNVVTPWSTYRANVKTLIIEDGVTSIGEFAFETCSNLADVTIPESVDEIGMYAFANCFSLKDITIPDDVTVITAAAFSCCEALETIYIPGGVTKIDDAAFGNCSSLTDVYYGGTDVQWNSIDVYNYDAENDILLSVEKHYNVAAWGLCGGPDMLWTLDTAGTLTVSGSHMMASYSQGEAPWYAKKDDIKEVIIGDGVTMIGTYAFADCTNMTHIKLPESVELIGSYAFYNCSSLTSVRIPGQVAGIPWHTFENCTSLKEVTLGGAIGDVGEAAFNNCTSLSAVYYAGTQDEWYNINFEESNNRFQYANWREFNISSGNCGDHLTWRFDPYGYLYITGSGDMPSFLSGEEPWQNHFYEIKYVIIENGVTSIGNNAFYCCWNLSRVRIPDSVSFIGQYAFYQCSKLTDVNIPEGVEAIQLGCFGACSSLKKVGIPASVGFIVREAFSGCTSLADVYYGGTEEQWDSIDIDNIEELNAPVINAAKHYNVAKYGDCGATAADHVTWMLDKTGTLTISGSGNMCTGEAGCAPWYDERTEIKKVVIEDGVKSISADDFTECTNLTEVTISDSVESIGMAAFSFCENLKMVSIPVSVTSIENHAFSYSGLTDICYAGTREQWDAITIGEYNDELKNAAIHCSDDTGVYIALQPTNVTATYGQTVAISFKAANAASYQWYYSKDDGASWTKLYWEGAKTDTLSVAYKASRADFRYKCQVKGTDGTTIETNVVSVIKGTAPAGEITSQPESVCANVGETVSFKITADNAVTYQWYYSKDDGASWTKLYWNGYDTDTLTFEVKKSRYSYVYYCKITDGNGDASYSKRCYLRQHFQLKKQPQDVTAAIGDTVNLTVSAVGVQSYQWYYSKDGGENWTKLSWTGAKSDTLSVDVTKTRCSYVYHCVLVGYDGNGATTNTVKITAAG